MKAIKVKHDFSVDGKFYFTGDVIEDKIKYETLVKINEKGYIEPLTLKDLTEYTLYHFENEEKFMADNDYYGIDVHKLAHDGFILEVKKQINQINDEDVESAEKFYIFVTKWVLTHIAKADKVWANFIKEKK